jgi:hypothetical protein
MKSGFVTDSCLGCIGVGIVKVAIPTNSREPSEFRLGKSSA